MIVKSVSKDGTVRVGTKFGRLIRTKGAMWRSVDRQKGNRAAKKLWDRLMTKPSSLT